jgi:predicted CXXCH cytochrome family protein
VIRLLRPASVLLVLTVALAWATSGRAQLRGSGHGIPSSAAAAEKRCGLCHGTHGVAQQTANLVQGTPLASTRIVSAVSRSCLRCHTTMDARMSDPVFAGYRRREQPSSPQTFLRDLLNDHPVARVGGQPDLRRRTARSATEALSRTRRRRSSTWGDEAPLPECTSCHEVHTGPDPTLSEEPQQGLCLECHATTNYMTGHFGLGCTSCHAMHGGQEVGLLREATTDLLCRSCHDPVGGAAANASIIPPLVLDLQRHAGRNATPVGDCLSCHAVHR